MDYSFVTGESEPVTHPAGAHLYAGGRQVGGAIEVETVKPVAQSYLATLWNHEAFRKNRDHDLDSLTNATASGSPSWSLAWRWRRRCSGFSRTRANH